MTKRSNSKHCRTRKNDNVVRAASETIQTNTGLDLYKPRLQSHTSFTIRLRSLTSINSFDSTSFSFVSDASRILLFYFLKKSYELVRRVMNREAWIEAYLSRNKKKKSYILRLRSLTYQYQKYRVETFNQFFSYEIMYNL